MSDDALTSKQKKGLAALLICPTLTAAAEQAGVDPRTLTRWLTQPLFISELKAAQTGVIDQATSRLLHGLTLALDTLVNLMTWGKSESVKRAAASEWLSSALVLHERSDFVRRLDNLERLVKHEHKKSID